MEQAGALAEAPAGSLPWPVWRSPLPYRYVSDGRRHGHPGGMCGAGYTVTGTGNAPTPSPATSSHPAARHRGEDGQNTGQELARYTLSGGGSELL